MQYIIDIAREIELLIDSNDGNAGRYIKSLYEELSRLDPRDFLASARTAFVLAKADIHDLAFKAGSPNGEARPLNANHTPLLHKLIEHLKCYEGEGSRARTRTFLFIKDEELRNIVNRDYGDLTLRVYPSGAWKSTVVLAGSILEAILCDQLTSDPTNAENACNSNYAKQNSNRLKGKHINQWSLHDFIGTCEELEIISKHHAVLSDQILRNYRNSIHPDREIRSRHPCSEGQAELASGALKEIIDHLASRSSPTV